MKRSLLHLLLPGLLWAAAIFAETGPELVKRRMPQFYEAWVTVAGEPAAHRYFADWDEAEVQFLEKKFETILRLTAPDAKATPPTDTLFERFNGTVFGSSGEVFGNAYLRKVAQETGVRFLDENNYALHNPSGKKPDGLLYRLEGDKLILLSVMESKLGKANWDGSQIQGCLSRWSSAGITIPVDGKIRAFPPSKVFMELDLKLTGIDKVTEEQVRQTSTRIGTRPVQSGPVGKYLAMPVDATAIREIAYAYFDLLRGNRPSPKGTSALPAPVLEPVELEDYQAALKDFMFDRGEWPKSSMGPLAAELRRTMSRRGGQAQAFLYDMDGATRFYLTERGILPPQGGLERHIAEGSPLNANIISGLRAYLAYFEKGRVGRSPFVESLRERSEDWAYYLGRHPIEELRALDATEMLSCYAHLASLGRAP